MANPSREIFCPISGEIIQQNHGIEGSTSTFLSFFEEIEPLGKGGFGEVVKCRRITDDVIFAMKKIDIRQPGMSLENVKREAEIMKNIIHPNIIRYYKGNHMCGHCYDSDDHLCTYKADSPYFYILMEFCPNKLSSYLKNEKVDMERKLAFIRQLVDAVSYMHSLEIIHRDLSSENILLDEQLNIKIIDFGLAVKAGEMGHVQSNPHGAHFYKAPELKKGKSIDSKVDIFSLGIWFFEILKDLWKNPERTLQLDDLRRPRLRSLHLNGLGAYGLLIGDMLADGPKQRPSASQIQEMKAGSDVFEYISDDDEPAVAVEQTGAYEEEMALE